ncbi:MAG: translation initiation factor IF-2 [Alphaproteobacteria bacterium]|nr:translation initiation factor IF-2 [Alphaproteobacteria bacterium]
MTDKKDTGQEKKPLTLSTSLHLKDIVGSGIVRSSTRSKTVVVEVKNRTKGPRPTSRTDSIFGAPKDTSLDSSLPSPGPKPLGQPVSQKDGLLTREEKDARLQALQRANQFVQKQEARRDEMVRRDAEIKKMVEEKEAKTLELLEFEKQQKAEQQESLGHPGSAQEEFKPKVKKALVDDEGEEDAHKKHHVYEVKKLGTGRRENNRHINKMTVEEALDDEERERTRSLSSLKRAREKERKKIQEQFNPLEKVSREVIIPDVISVQDLANRMAERGATVIKTLMKLGVMATITQVIDADTAQLVVEEMGHRFKRISDADLEESLIAEKDKPEDLKPRPPVVTIMGHVDHGKTSLLDALRTTDVASGEAGGITQHIGAYQVTLGSGDKITFIDTPGHAAFTEMRARGAHVTDIVIIVVAADDGLKEQTVEAINHAKAAKVPIIVAINKIDKPGADAFRVKNELLTQELVVEEMGGDILCIEVSATKKINLDKLTEAILLQAEMLDLKANPSRDAVGSIIEAKIEKGRGPVATVLVQNGTLRTGDIFVAGMEFGKVRLLLDDKGEPIKEAAPGLPVEILGFDGVPHAGDTFFVVKDESKAREVADHRRLKKRERKTAQEVASVTDFFAQTGDVKELAVVVKADVQGSAEAIIASLQKLATDEVRVRVLHCGVGGINETDISLANASRALIIGFNVRANAQAREQARIQHLDIRYYSIIYEIIDDVKALMGGMLSPISQETFIGRATVRQIFKISKIGTIAGCYVTEGVVRRGSKVRILRDDVVVHEGPLKSLKRLKDEAKEVKNNLECGMAFENYNDLREGDVIECSEVKEVSRTL